MKVTTTDSDGKKVSEIVSTEQQNSVEVSMNAKGEAAWKVKVYNDNPIEMERTLSDYIVKAQLMCMKAKGDA